MVENLESTASIVVVGRINPLIFQPEWLRANNIIGEQEAEAAANSIEVIHRDVTLLNLTSMKLIVEQNRFAVTALEEPLVRVRDFSVGCFNLLSHTPVTALGLNTTLSFRTDVDSWNSLGDRLAPKADWKALLGQQEERTGGLRSLTMELSKRPNNNLKGFIRVTIAALEKPDTKISFNDHYVLSDSENNPAPAREAVKLIEDRWEPSMSQAAEIFRSLTSLCE